MKGGAQRCLSLGDCMWKTGLQECLPPSDSIDPVGGGAEGRPEQGVDLRNECCMSTEHVSHDPSQRMSLKPVGLTSPVF